MQVNGASAAAQPQVVEERQENEGDQTNSVAARVMGAICSPLNSLSKTLGSWCFSAIKLFPGNERFTYRASLLLRQADHTLHPEDKPWWNEVIENLIIGAIPLLNWDHLTTLVEMLGVKAVLSMNELHELSTSGLCSIPVTQEQWEEKGVEFMQIESEDFLPPSLENIDRGVEFVHVHIQQAHKTYVHCKAGRGRSAIIVICYLMKYHRQNVGEALSFLTAKRPQIHMNDDQLACLHQYKAQYCVS